MTNQSVVIAFANGKVAKSINLFSTGDKLINYNTCIAQRTEDGAVIVNVTKYSTTTSKIQTYTKHALYNYTEVTHVPINTQDLRKFLN